MIWIFLAAALAAFCLILLLRAAAFRPRPQPAPEATPVSVDTHRAVAHLQEMIRCRTVSNQNPALAAPVEEFDRFRQLLTERYPGIHAACTLERLGPTGLLYRLPGRQPGEPSVFMAHYDVVPVNQEGWEKPAFDGILEDGVLWGRGTLDTKTTLLGIMEALESLLAGGFVPAHDIYLAFAGDEEIAGTSQQAIVAAFEARGITPALVSDEGGAVVENVFPGVKARCALIGTGEKGMMDLRLSMESAGGHASAPPPHTLVGQLARACVRVEGRPFPFQLTPPAAEMFDTLGRRSSFGLRLVFANLWCFRPVLNLLCKKTGGEMNALVRTTCAFTCMEGSKGTNVLPPHASMIANLRLCGSTTMERAKAHIAKVMKTPGVELTILHGMNPSPFSRTDSPGWARMTAAVRATWPDAVVSPYLMVACSDSRHYCRISENVYRFSAMQLSKQDRAAIHGNNERITVEQVTECVAFYTRLIGSC